MQSRMFGFLMNRRQRPEPDITVDEYQTTKRVLMAFLAMFFGCLFLFLELYGKCGCSLDRFGYLFLTIGAIVLLFYCIKDILFGVVEDEEEEVQPEEVGFVVADVKKQEFKANKTSDLKNNNSISRGESQKIKCECGTQQPKRNQILNSTSIDIQI